METFSGVAGSPMLEVVLRRRELEMTWRRHWLGWKAVPDDWPDSHGRGFDWAGLLEAGGKNRENFRKDSSVQNWKPKPVLRDQPGSELSEAQLRIWTRSQPRSVKWKDNFDTEKNRKTNQAKKNLYSTAELCLQCLSSIFAARPW